MRPSTALLSLAALAASALGCGATVEVPRICFSTGQPLAVPGSPVGGAVTSPPFAVDVTSRIPFLRANTSDTDVRVEEVTITPLSGNPDLSGVQTAKVQAQPASGAAVDVVQYQRDPAAPPPTALVLDGGSVNLAPYLDAGRANLTFALSGRLPGTSWTAEVKTCIRGQTSVSP